MDKLYDSKSIISFPYEENCSIVKNYLNKCGLDCKVDKIYPSSFTINSRHNWGCKIYYNKNSDNDKIINNYLEENSYVNRLINKYK